MMTSDVTSQVSYEQFSDAWLSEFKDGALSELEKGRRFAIKLITEWLDVTDDDEDFVICDRSGDGGIDIAYLKRADFDAADPDEEKRGDTWYLVQSKYGSAYSGSQTIFEEGRKVLSTLRGQNTHLNASTALVKEKIDVFRRQMTEDDQLVLVFATTESISEHDRQALTDIEHLGRKDIHRNFHVKEVSLLTLWELLDVPVQRMAVPVNGQFIEQLPGLLIGTVSLTDLFEFMQSYKQQTGDLDRLYEKNVRKYLGRRKVSKDIACTLENEPEKFGLYNNGITIVVLDYSEPSDQGARTLTNPFVVNGCQTTRTIYDTLQPKFEAGGSGDDPDIENWKQRLARGGLVVKVARSDDAEVLNITTYTNSQNQVRQRDFLALQGDFRRWASEMVDYGVYLEVQRGAWAARQAYQVQHPSDTQFEESANAFDLVKVYGAGWMGEPGTAFGKNAPFLPLPPGRVYKDMIMRADGEIPFGARDLYAAYKIDCAAKSIGFGRKAKEASRRQTRFLFYHVLMQMLQHVIQFTPQLQPTSLPQSVLTESVLKLSEPGAVEQFNLLTEAAMRVIDRYMDAGREESVHHEPALIDPKIHNQDLNAFLKSEQFGKDGSPFLTKALEIQNEAFNMQGMPGIPSGGERIAQVLLGQ